MNEAMSGKWGPLLDALLGAQSHNGAQLAAAELIDETVPGGAATAVGSADFVRLVRSRSEIRVNPYRSYVLGILLAMGTWVGTWRRMAASRDSNVPPTVVASEMTTESELIGACTDFADLTSDIDPEVRSLTYLLIGATARPVIDAVEQLKGLLDQEQHILAHACAMQALVRATMRLPIDRRSDMARYISERIGVDSPLDRARVNLELTSVAYSPIEKRQLLDLFGPGFDEQPNASLRWPTEGL